MHSIQSSNMEEIAMQVDNKITATDDIADICTIRYWHIHH
jgi:hypothetical protein